MSPWFSAQPSGVGGSRRVSEGSWFRSPEAPACAASNSPCLNDPVPSQPSSSRRLLRTTRPSRHRFSTFLYGEHITVPQSRERVHLVGHLGGRTHPKYFHSSRKQTYVSMANTYDALPWSWRDSVYLIEEGEMWHDLSPRMPDRYQKDSPDDGPRSSEYSGPRF